MGPLRWEADAIQDALESLAPHHVQLCHGHELDDWAATGIASDRHRCHGWGVRPIDALNALESDLWTHGRIRLERRWTNTPSIEPF